MTLAQADGVTAYPLKILAIVASLAPSVSLGILRPMLSLERAGIVSWRVLMEQCWTVNDIRDADVIIFCRNQSLDAYTAALIAKSEGKKIIYEIDDNFFEIPANSTLGQQHRQPKLLHTTRRMFELADVTRVYSSKMAQLAQSFGAHVHHNRAYFDMSIIRGIEPRPVLGKVRIAFATGRSPDPVAEQALEEAIRDVIEIHPETVQFHYWRSPSNLLRNRPQIFINKGVADYNEFIRQFYTAGYDIGLAPLLGTPFYESKTNSKYREYGGCGVAGIYSQSGPYADSVVPDQTGIVVDNTREGWRLAMLKLIENPPLRQLITEQAKADVEKNYSYAEYLRAWLESLSQAISSDRKTDLKPLLFNRNIAVSKAVSSSKLGRPKSFQVEAIRGGEWSSRTTFITNVIGHFGKSTIIDGSGVINWLVASSPSHLDSASLRTMLEAEIRVICDLRFQDFTAATDLIARVKAYGQPVAIIVCNQEQVALLGEEADSELLANVNHPDYPRPQRLPTSYGYLVVAPRPRPLLENMSLAGTDGVWLEIFDTMSAFHPLGRPVGPKLSRWYSKLPMKQKLRYFRLINPQDLLRALHARGAHSLYRLRWQRLRWTIQSDAELENDLRGDFSKNSEKHSNRLKELD